MRMKLNDVYEKGSASVFSANAVSFLDAWHLVARPLEGLPTQVEAQIQLVVTASVLEPLPIHTKRQEANINHTNVPPRQECCFRRVAFAPPRRLETLVKLRAHISRATCLTRAFSRKSARAIGCARSLGQLARAPGRNLPRAFSRARVRNLPRVRVVHFVPRVVSRVQTRTLDTSSRLLLCARPRACCSARPLAHPAARKGYQLYQPFPTPSKKHNTRL